MQQSSVKNNDVFNFRWSPKKDQGWDSRYHCFEGLLVAQVTEDNIRFVDTYWGIGDSQGQVLTFEEIEQEIKNGGEIEYYCNLDEVERIENWQKYYYADKDLFYLHTQKACIPRCEFYFIRKGATRSKEKMLEVINEKVRKARQAVEMAVDDVQVCAVQKQRIEAGDLSVHF